MAKRAVIIYGPPGAGKGTQANLLAWRKNFIHFDTGKYLEQFLHDPANQKNKLVQREKKLFEKGILLMPAFVLSVTSDKAKEIAQADYSIVFSGSPRTLFEAFGDRKNMGLIELLKKEYGRKNIYPIFLDINPRVAIRRNAKRMVCSVCGNAVIYSADLHKHRTCPLCGALLRKRSVDNPAIFKTRIKEYKERTFPILAELKKRGYKIIKVDGKPMPFEVHAQILNDLS